MEDKLRETLIDMSYDFFTSECGLLIEKDILADVDFILDLSMDSLMYISFIIKIEEIFEITIPDDFLIMDNFNSIDSIANLLTEIMRGA